jgi:hypothetical protein
MIAIIAHVPACATLQIGLQDSRMGEAKRNPSATDTMRGLYDGLRLAASTHPTGCCRARLVNKGMFVTSARAYFLF